MASVPRSEKILNGLAQRAGITECGQRWLIEALDPFHDTMINPVGYPDTNGSASVLQVVKQSYQVAAPITTGNWDCNIAMMPWLNPVAMNTTTANQASLGQNYLFQTTTTSQISVGGVQIISAASGTPLILGSVSNTAGASQNTANTVPSTYLNGNQRVVAMAMEICNTTSDLNKQGLVTVYRVPIPQNDDGTAFTIRSNATGDTTSNIGAASGVYVPMPPSSIAAAQLFAGTKAWPAEKGTYQAAVFNTPDVPASGLNFTMPILYNSTQLDGQVTAPLFSRNVNDNFPTTAGICAVPNVSWTEFDMSGAYFTGLSNSTTLTVNYIVYIERFPTQDDLDLIVVAKRSPEYDIKALEAYSIISQSLPVAVPFDENGLGDWFKSAVNAASEYISPVLKMIPHPYAQLGANAISVAKGVSDSFDQPPSDVTVPQAPMGRGEEMILKSYAPKRRGAQVNAKQLQKAQSKLKKAVRNVRKDVQAVGRVTKKKRTQRPIFEI